MLSQCAISKEGNAVSLLSEWGGHSFYLHWSAKSLFPLEIQTRDDKWFAPRTTLILMSSRGLCAKFVVTPPARRSTVIIAFGSGKFVGAGRCNTCATPWISNRRGAFRHKSPKRSCCSWTRASRARRSQSGCQMAFLSRTNEHRAVPARRSNRSAYGLVVAH